MTQQTFKSMSDAMAAIKRAQHAEDMKRAANLRRSAPLAAKRAKGSGPRVAR